MFSAVLFSGLAPNSFSPRARARARPLKRANKPARARARGGVTPPQFRVCGVSQTPRAPRKSETCWANESDPEATVTLQQATFLSLFWFLPYSLTVFLTLALSFSAGALFGLSQVHLQSFDVLFSLTGNLQTSEDRVDARLCREAEMELLIICLSFGILQCNSVGADSIIHIGKEWAAQSLYLFKMIMNAPSRMRTLREVCCWGRREISIVNKHENVPCSLGWISIEQATCDDNVSLVQIADISIALTDA